jgi:hypothetical protein
MENYILHTEDSEAMESSNQLKIPGKGIFWRFKANYIDLRVIHLRWNKRYGVVIR